MRPQRGENPQINFSSTWDGLDFSSSPLQLNCDLESVGCKHCYCWRRNQTFMRRRDRGSSRESGSRMRWRVCETAASPSTRLALSPFSSLSSQLSLRLSSITLSLSFLSLVSFSSSPLHPLLLFFNLYSSTPSLSLSHLLPSHLPIAPLPLLFRIFFISESIFSPFCYPISIKKTTILINP